jgi:hypothetical protein
MPEMVEACRRQDFTTILGLARKYTGASYNLISRCTGIAPTEISAIVNGRQQVEKFNRILAIANALAMPDSARVLLGLAPGSTPAAARLTGRRAVLHGAVVGTGAALTGGLLTALDGAQQALRRSLADEPLDRCDIERLEESADGLALFSPTAPPVEALTRMLLDFLEVQESLDARPPLALHRRLQHVAAQISSLIADEVMVLGDPDRSRGWHELAGVGADELGDNPLRAQIRALAAMLPLYYGDPAHAVQLARSAHRIPLTMPAASTALALALEALALAPLGDAHAARRALGTARDAYDRLGDPQHRTDIFVKAGHGVAQAVPPEQRQVAAAAEYQELLGSLAVAVAH